MHIPTQLEPIAEQISNATLRSHDRIVITKEEKEEEEEEERRHVSTTRSLGTTMRRQDSALPRGNFRASQTGNLKQPSDSAEGIEMDSLAVRSLQQIQMEHRRVEVKKRGWRRYFSCGLCGDDEGTEDECEFPARPVGQVPIPS